MLAAYFMKRNDLLFWLSIVWLAVWCVARRQLVLSVPGDGFSYAGLRT